MATAGNSDETADIGPELKALREDLAALIETVKGLGAKQAAGAAESVHEAVNEMADRLKTGAGDARRQGEAVAQEFAAMIARRPVGSILAALALGYVVGKLKHRCCPG